MPTPKSGHINLIVMTTNSYGCIVADFARLYLHIQLRRGVWRVFPTDAPGEVVEPCEKVMAQVVTGREP